MFRLVRVLCLSLFCGLVLTAAPTFEGNEKVNCGGVYKDKAGAIESPGWPQKYPARLHCVYEIGVLPGRKITLRFPAFHLRPRVGRRCLDRLRLYDGDNLIGRVSCGREINPTRSYTSKSSKVTVVFTSHRRRGTRGFPGFRATYSSFECGVPVFPRREWSRSTGNKIVGGNVAAPGSYPWQVALMFVNRDNPQYACSGALLSENWVITTASCVISAGSRSRTIVPILGANNLNNYLMGQRAKVQNIIVHPQFANGTEYDIALLKLESPVSLNDYVMPICLPEAGLETPPGTVVTVTGWGYTNDQIYPAILQQADIPVVADEECRNNYVNTGPIVDSMICTGYPKGGVGACFGDSGGPVVAFPSEGPAYLVGIASVSIGCGIPGIPGVNTEVSYFVPWIYDIMDKNT